jgi:hypothetical protein
MNHLALKASFVDNALYSDRLKCLSVDNTDEENQDEENVEGRYGEA